MRKKRDLDNDTLLKITNFPNDKRFVDLSNKRFGRLLVIGYSGTSKRSSYWYCQCDCGNIRNVKSFSLRKGMTFSCGCYGKEKLIENNILQLQHGHAIGKNSPTYNIWKALKSRCKNPNNINYSNYGGRGITVCERWLKFENFLEDMGERPGKLSIDRVDNDGNYEPSNCRWATLEEQDNNKQNTLRITFNNKTQSLKQWSIELNINYDTLYARVATYKWPIDKAFTKRLQTGKK